MKKTVMVVVALAAVLSFTGCSYHAPGTQKLANGYEQETVSWEDGSTVDCLWYNRGGRTGSMDCDFTHPLSVSNKPVTSGYQQKTVKTASGDEVICLWYNFSGRTGSMSCDFAHPLNRNK